MDKEKAEYVTRDFSAVDRHVEELAKRERILTWRLFIDNLKRLGLPLILIACAIAILLIAIGILVWFIKNDKVKEVEKVVRKETVKEVPVVSERVNIVEVPKFVPIFPNEENIVQFNKLQNDTVLYERIRKVIEDENITNTEEKLDRIQTIINQSRFEGSTSTLGNNQPTLSSGQDVKIPSAEKAKLESKKAKQRLKENNIDLSGKSLSFSLTWNNTNDLDLHVQTPNKDWLYYRKKRKTGLGAGSLDVDKNASKLTTRPVENISFGNAIAGQYNASVSIYANRSPSNESYTNYTLIIYQNGQPVKIHSDRIKNTEIKGRRVNLITFNHRPTD